MAQLNTFVETLEKTLEEMESDPWLHIGDVWGEPETHKLTHSHPWREVRHRATSEWFPRALAGVEGWQIISQCEDIYAECDNHLADTLGVIGDRLGNQVMRGYARILQANGVANTLVTDGAVVWDLDAEESEPAYIVRDSGTWWLNKEGWESMYELGADEWDIVLMLMSANWSFI